ncbi:exonuclease [Pseudomonas entomophila]|uniref:exonuclease domain-containing protein n=1 Tax=Pseudomonas entomophila TaxID=312306 RepID=UPI0015E2D611|nr:exonuclease domain-containing protein [Pseudomonas entomophila]MBA1187923.1 exonuclease [Pseudomonas entomophila]
MGHWLVIDLEATTDEGGWPITEMEIIEIGASLVNREGREVDHFQRFVRPRRRPQLTTFCRHLTHIGQASIDAAEPFAQVWAQFERWLVHHQPRLEGWVSWGDYDRRQLLQEWQVHGVQSLLGALPHVNLKQRFAKARQLQRPTGLNGALHLAGLQFAGQQHRALEDARNTARLLPLSLPLARA